MDEEPEVPAPVNPVELQEILMKIQSMLMLVKDLDLLLHLARDDFNIPVGEGEAEDINQVKVILLTYLLGNFARLQATEGILDKLAGIFETVTNHLTDVAEAAEEEQHDILRRENTQATRRRPTDHGGDLAGDGIPGVMGGVHGANGIGLGLGRAGLGGVGRGTGVTGGFADPYDLGTNGRGRGGLGRGFYGLGGPLNVKPPPLSPRTHSTPRPDLFAAAGAGGGGSPPRGGRIHHLRDFKISGQIGEPGQADKLTFSNLLHQILTARTQLYSDEEIIAAVVKACTPGLSLRTYLEGRPGMTMQTLMTILRTHFKEKDATAVFNEMSNASQGPKDTEHSFCMRMMGLRDKVMLLTREEDNLYDARLVQTQFQHALYTGFRSENARHALSLILKTPNVTDSDLLVAINEYMMNVAEHKSKTEATKQTVNQVKFQGNIDGKDPGAGSRTASRVVNKEKENSLLTKVSETVDQISQLTALVNELSTKVHEISKPEPDQMEFPGMGRGNRRPFMNPWGNDGFLYPPWAPWNPPPVGPAATPPATSAAPPNRGRGGGGGRGTGRGGGRRSGLGRCPTCLAANENHCPHCFKCGETGHKKEECPN